MLYDCCIDALRPLLTRLGSLGTKEALGESGDEADLDVRVQHHHLTSHLMLLPDLSA
jgi:hypothetical protein